MLGSSLKEQDIYIDENGLKIHIQRRHPEHIAYLEKLSEIINNPDFIGINPKENTGQSIELIKRYDENILVGIKLDVSNNYLYVATLHEIKESKINRRLHSGRLKAIN